MSIQLNHELPLPDTLKKEYVDINGHVIKSKPQYSSIYGLGSYGVVGKEVRKAILVKE